MISYLLCLRFPRSILRRGIKFSANILLFAVKRLPRTRRLWNSGGVTMRRKRTSTAIQTEPTKRPAKVKKLRDCGVFQGRWRRLLRLARSYRDQIFQRLASAHNRGSPLAGDILSRPLEFRRGRTFHAAPPPLRAAKRRFSTFFLLIFKATKIHSARTFHPFVFLFFFSHDLSAFQGERRKFLSSIVVIPIWRLANYSQLLNFSPGRRPAISL